MGKRKEYNFVLKKGKSTHYSIEEAEETKDRVLQLIVDYAMKNYDLDKIEATE